MGEIAEPEVPKPSPEPSSWLSLRVFYLRLSRCEVNESMLDSLTITHSPLTSDTVLEVNGGSPSTNKNGHVSCPLRRDRVDAASREATFVSTATVRMAGSVRFEVRVGSGEKLLVGIMEMCDVAEEKKGWVMKCQVAMQRGSGFLKAGGEEAKSPMVEVYVASLFRGNPVVFTKAMKLRLRRTRQVKAPFMEPIPECGELAEDAKETPPDEKHDPQESGYRCYRPEMGMEDVDLDSLYMGSAGLEEDEDSELSWFTTGVRVGVGISLGIFLGVGIGAGLLARSSRGLKRRLISGLL